MAWWSTIFKQNKKPENIIGLRRNDPCWCGSGKKYKRCHLETDLRKRAATLTCTSSS